MSCAANSSACISALILFSKIVTNDAKVSEIVNVRFNLQIRWRSFANAHTLGKHKTLIYTFVHLNIAAHEALAGSLLTKAKFQIIYNYII